MLKKIKKYMVLWASMLALIAPISLPAAISYADDAGGCNGVADTVAKGATQASNGGRVSCSPNSTISADNVGTLASKIVNIFSVIVGAAAIIMIIYAGFRYITSGGSSERIGSAKTTLIYAIIGLIVVALAQILVHFVLSQAISAGTSVQSS